MSTHQTFGRLQPLAALMSLSLLTALSACGGGGPTEQDISLDFAAYAGSTAVKCGTLVTGLGSKSNSAQIKDFRFYVTNVKLIAADGSKTALTVAKSDAWNLISGSDTITLIDLEDATGSCSSGTAGTNASVKGKVPSGSYVGVEFTMGVPFALNHSDYATAAQPLDSQAMAWSWQSGRKFAKIEVTDPDGTSGTWTAKTFNFHLGSTGCTGNPASGQTVSCTASNRMTVPLASFNTDSQKVAVDIKALLADTDITVNQAGAAGCMSGGTDPECVNVFKSLAIDWKSDGSGTGQPINSGAGQTLFKAVAK